VLPGAASLRPWLVMRNASKTVTMQVSLGGKTLTTMRTCPSSPLLSSYRLEELSLLPGVTSFQSSLF